MSYSIYWKDGTSKTIDKTKDTLEETLSDVGIMKQDLFCIDHFEDNLSGEVIDVFSINPGLIYTREI